MDTSAAVALVVEEHDAHTATLQALAGSRLGLSGHAWFETYSVLTRLPPPVRRVPSDVARILERNFPASCFLSADDHAALSGDLPRLGLSGGSVYDALVGAAARAAGLELCTRDRRAQSTYRALGVRIRLLD